MDGNRVAFWGNFFLDFCSSLFSARDSSLTALAKSSSTALNFWLHVILSSKSPGVLLLDCQARLAVNGWYSGRLTIKGGVPSGNLGSLERFNELFLDWIARM